LNEDEAVLNSPDRIQNPPSLGLNFGNCICDLANCILTFGSVKYFV